MAGAIIPVLEIIGEALTATGEVVTANAGKAVVVTGVAYGAAKLSNSNSSTSTNTTTVTGKGKMNCGDSGKYGDLLDQTGDGNLDRDHVPSKAALKEAAREILRKNPLLARKMTEAMEDKLFGTKSSPGLIAEEGEAIAIPSKDHQKFSDTYGGRNKEAKVKEDAGELQKAAKKDTKAIEEAEGKKMDDECLEKYKKAAEKIRQKTHEEYIKDLKALLDKVINKK